MFNLREGKEAKVLTSLFYRYKEALIEGSHYDNDAYYFYFSKYI